MIRVFLAHNVQLNRRFIIATGKPLIERLGAAVAQAVNEL